MSNRRVHRHYETSFNYEFSCPRRRGTLNFEFNKSRGVSHREDNKSYTI